MSSSSPPVAPQKTHANPRCCQLLNVHRSTRKSCTHTSKCNGSSGAGVAANVGAATTGCTTTAASCLAQTGTVLPPPVVGLGASTRTPDSANFPLLRHLAASLPPSPSPTAPRPSNRRSSWQSRGARSGARTRMLERMQLQTWSCIQ
jgi:hypothetical protein